MAAAIRSVGQFAHSDGILLPRTNTAGRYLSRWLRPGFGSRCAGLRAGHEAAASVIGESTSAPPWPLHAVSGWSGLSQTYPIGCQFQVWPDQRVKPANQLRAVLIVAKPFTGQADILAVFLVDTMLRLESILKPSCTVLCH